MMKFVKLMLVSVMLLAGINGIAQLPCNRMQARSEVMAQLKNKPVPGMRPMYYSLDCNVDDSVKKRILYLLDWRWTETEVETYLNLTKKDYSSVLKLKEEDSVLAKGNNDIFLRIFDSLLAKTCPAVSETFSINLFRVNNGIILTAAFLGIKESVPLLQKAAGDPVHYHIPTVELALAKLGDKKMQEKIIESSKYNSNLDGHQWNDEFTKTGIPLIFLATQESIYNLTDWLDTSKNYAFKSSGILDTKNAANVILYLSNSILNDEFQKVVRPVNKSRGEDFSVVDSKMILWVKSWMNVNKGKYQINTQYSPY